MTPTQRTLKELRDAGLTCGIVERWIPMGQGKGFRKDLFGIIDIIAIGSEGVVGVQSCGQAFAAHKKKMIEEKAVESALWLSTPGTSLQLWGWRKIKKKRGGKLKIWAPRILEITLEMIKETNNG